MFDRSLSLVELICMVVVASSPTTLRAHSGGTDSNGCHSGSQPYHCHSGASGGRSASPVSSRNGRIKYRSLRKKPAQKSLKLKTLMLVGFATMTPITPVSAQDCSARTLLIKIEQMIGILESDSQFNGFGPNEYLLNLGPPTVRRNREGVSRCLANDTVIGNPNTTDTAGHRALIRLQYLLRLELYRERIGISTLPDSFNQFNGQPRETLNGSPVFSYVDENGTTKHVPAIEPIVLVPHWFSSETIDSFVHSLPSGRLYVFKGIFFRKP